MSDLLDFWFFTGAFYLLFLTYQDVTNKRLVDDRKNSFMLGLTYGLILQRGLSLWYLAAVLVIMQILYYILNKTKALGKADNNTILWLYTGLALLGPSYLIIYTGFFISILIFIYGLKKAFGIIDPIPFYPVFLASFLLIWFVSLYS